jgi:acyl-CoA dehydrogenase
MSDERRFLVESAAGLIARHRSPQHDDISWDEPLWDALEAHDFPLVSIAEEVGGAGGDLEDAAALARLAGQTAISVPLADAVLVGGWILGEAGLDPSAGLCVAALHCDDVRLERRGDAWQLTGALPAVPWGRAAKTVAFVVDGPDGPMVVRLDGGRTVVTPGHNLAGEPRDDLVVDVALADGDVVPAPPHVDGAAVLRRGALSRALSIAGALEEVLAMTVAFVQQREQFGRPISRFQAVQQQVAALAGEVASASIAADAAVLAETRGPSPAAVAVAKARASHAAGEAAALAHQLHGAIGFTDEYALHHLTRRLWAWRDECGSETEWWITLGREAAAAGPDGVWPALTLA